MTTVVTFVGSRSELIQLSAVIPLLQQVGQHFLVHSGQRYARDVDEALRADLGLPHIDHNLGVAAEAGSEAQQIGRMVIGLADVLLERPPDALVVEGASNTALVGALTAGRLDIPVAHAEAGLRTAGGQAAGDSNGAVIDRMSRWLFAPDPAASRRLLAEGLDSRSIHVVGSIGIDACRRSLALAASRPSPMSHLDVQPGQYILVTLRRDENAEPNALRELVPAIKALARIWPVVFPMHPRTRQALEPEAFGRGILHLDPPGYLDMLHLVRQARALLTDSGHWHEAAAALGTPGLIMRSQSERMHLIEAGASALVGNTYQSLMDRAWPLIASDASLAAMRDKAAALPAHAAQHIVEILGRDLQAERPAGDTAERLPRLGAPPAVAAPEPYRGG